MKLFQKNENMRFKRRIKNINRFNKVKSHNSIGVCNKVDVNFQDGTLNIPKGFIFSVNKHKYIVTEFGIVNLDNGDNFGFGTSISKRQIGLIGFDISIPMGDKVLIRSNVVSYNDLPKGSYFKINSRRYKDVIFVKSEGYSVSINKLFINSSGLTYCTISHNKLSSYTCYI